MSIETLPGYHGNNRGVTDKKIAFTNKALVTDVTIDDVTDNSVVGFVMSVESHAVAIRHQTGASPEMKTANYFHGNM